jgi:hypothetical protein
MKMRTNQENDTYIEFIDPNNLIAFESVDKNHLEELDENQLDSQLESIFEEGELSEKFEETSQDYVIKKKEDIRGRLAIIYTVLTFSVFILGFLAAIIDSLMTKSSLIQNLQVILPLISGIFLGTLGFVIGYYFKKENE